MLTVIGTLPGHARTPGHALQQLTMNATGREMTLVNIDTIVHVPECSQMY